MNIGICDDDKIMVEQIKICIKKYFAQIRNECNIYFFYSGKEVLFSNTDLDLLFLDIDMPEISGMETAKRIYANKEKKTTIVFLTNYDKEVRNAFKVNAYRFLLKEYFEDEINECLDAYCKEKSNELYIIIKIENQDIKILQKDILYIKAKHNGSEIWMKEKMYINNNTLDIWMKKLDNTLFVRCHRGSIVNLAHIYYIDDCIVMDTGEKVEVSRRNKAEVRKKFNQYSIDNMR